MPAIRTPSYQRHFSPLTTRTTFKQERLRTPPPLAYHVIYRLTNDIAPGSIKKPNGEVTRLARGGYKLQVELKWSDDKYQAFQVRVYTR